MTNEAPKIDARTAADIEQQVRTLLGVHAKEWHEFNSEGRQDRLAAALIAIFARYSEIIIQRLNDVPHKNFLAFLDLLGASLQPPQPAQAPLTFSLAAGSVADGVVPPGTQAASPPGEGETEPVIFETERELIVTAAQLNAVFVRDAEQDKYDDLSSLVGTTSADGELIFEGQTSVEHILYVGDADFFGLPNLSEVKLELSFNKTVEEEMTIGWERWSDDGWVEIGKLISAANDQKPVFNLGKLDPIPPSEVAGVNSRWVRGRLLTPITLSQTRQPGKVREGQLPTISAPQLTSTISGVSLLVENSFNNQFPVDASKDFFPLGEKPKLGDAWLIGQNEVFSQSGVKVTLDITLGGDVRTEGNPELTWEFWTDEGWQALTPKKNAPENGQVHDGTANLTKTGKVVIRLPGRSLPKEINGVESSWLRVRLSRGNYGVEAQYVETTIPPDNTKAFVVVGPTFKPPIIRLVNLSYEGTKVVAAEDMLGFNNLVFSKPVAPMVIPDTNPTPNPNVRVGQQPLMLKPFRSLNEMAVGGEIRPTLYLGFTLPAGGRFAQRAVSLYFNLVEPLFGKVAADTGAQPELSWECWNGRVWERLVVNDDTQALRRAGLVEFLPPAGFTARQEFGLTRHWLRVRWEKGDYRFKPLTRRLLLNTTMAMQSATFRAEILGSSDGSKNQGFRATRTPILKEPQLEVREPELPPVAEQRGLKIEEGEDAIKTINDAAGRPQEIWVRWHEVSDFYGSLPRDRHYVLDHLTGEIRFGDGSNGLVPPAGVGNLRLARYRTGGGSSGNRTAGSIVQLKTTVPYVDKVANYEPATGGADAELLDSLLERAPRTIRHNGRAVTVEDFEDVAMLASPEMARVKCVPLRNLIADPLDKNVSIDPLTGQLGLPGHVSVIVIPHSTAPKPLPSLTLLDRVREYLDDHALPTARVWVTGPLYQRVDVEVEVAPVSLEGAGALEQAVQQRLTAFLHPLTGGLDRKGWDFGREPHKSDLYALIEAVPGVDHINLLKLQVNVDEQDRIVLNLIEATAVAEIKATKRFLVYSGVHKVTLKFEET